MKSYLSLILLLFSVSISAETINGKVLYAEEGKGGKDHLLFLTNGKVIFVKYSNKAFFKKFKNKSLIETSSNKISPEAYHPSILPDLRSADRIFADMRDDYKEDEGQCYNMAHIWAYEAYKKSNLNSMKLFLFFTSKYIRRYQFPWWFHVAPMVKVNPASPKSMVLDKVYATNPLPVKEWTDNFIGTKRECKKIEKLSQYIKSSKVQDCYLIETSMYFWQPKDIRIRDTEGKVKSSFIKHELNHALRDAF